MSRSELFDIPQYRTSLQVSCTSQYTKMKVICAGLSKTGTTSLASALRVLGFKVYDFPEHVDFHGNEWLAIYRGELTPDFASMYEDVDAVTDLPAAFWYQEILKAFPDAKIILTVRDNDEVWVQSWVKHLQIFRELDVFSRLVFAVTKPLGGELASITDYAVYGSRNPTATSLFKKKYNAHNERVQAVIPSEKLLVYNVKQGWRPLCQFLGIDIPSQGFPHENVGGSAARSGMAKFCKEHKQNIMFAIFPILLVLVGIIIVYSLYWN